MSQREALRHLHYVAQRCTTCSTKDEKPWKMEGNEVVPSRIPQWKGIQCRQQHRRSMITVHTDNDSPVWGKLRQKFVLEGMRSGQTIYFFFRGWKVMGMSHLEYPNGRVSTAQTSQIDDHGTHKKGFNSVVNYDERIFAEGRRSEYSKNVFFYRRKDMGLSHLEYPSGRVSNARASQKDYTVRTETN